MPAPHKTSHKDCRHRPGLVHVRVQADFHRYQHTTTAVLAVLAALAALAVLAVQYYSLTTLIARTTVLHVQKNTTQQPTLCGASKNKKTKNRI